MAQLRSNDEDRLSVWLRKTGKKKKKRKEKGKKEIKKGEGIPVHSNFIVTGNKKALRTFKWMTSGTFPMKVYYAHSKHINM